MTFQIGLRFNECASGFWYIHGHILSHFLLTTSDLGLCFHRLDTVPERERQTDGRTDRRTEFPSCIILTHDKNRAVFASKKQRRHRDITFLRHGVFLLRQVLR